jgi:hypothetical protein
MGVVGGQGFLVPWSPDEGDFQGVVVGAIEEMIANQILPEVRLEVAEDELGLVEHITPDQYLNVAASEEVSFSIGYREAFPEGTQSASVTFDLVSGDTRLKQYTVEVRLDN